MESHRKCKLMEFGHKNAGAKRTLLRRCGGELGIRTLGSFWEHDISSVAPSTSRTTLRIYFYPCFLPKNCSKIRWGENRRESKKYSILRFSVLRSIKDNQGDEIHRSCRNFESSCQNRTWRNLTEDNGKCENPENAMFSRLSAPLCIENTVKIRVRKSPPISPSSNGFLGKPIRIFDRTERFFVPKSRFWQCVKSPGYAELHQKSCRLIRLESENSFYALITQSPG